jgi:hypothetical protein
MKAYRFFSEPGRVVSDGNTGLAMFKFDENGEYITLDAQLYKRMAPHFKHEEVELVEVNQKEVAEKEAGNDAQVPCPYCEYKAKNEFGLKAHIRAKHKEV